MVMPPAEYGAMRKMRRRVRQPEGRFHAFATNASYHAACFEGTPERVARCRLSPREGEGGGVAVRTLSPTNIHAHALRHRRMQSEVGVPLQYRRDSRKRTAPEHLRRARVDSPAELYLMPDAPSRYAMFTPVPRVAGGSAQAAGGSGAACGVRACAYV